MTTRRNVLIGGLAAIAAPAVISNIARAEVSSIKIGSIFSGTTMQAPSLPRHLEKAGVKAEVLDFANITQRMQALAAGETHCGYASVNGAILLAAKGLDLVTLCNGCEGGWYLVGKPQFKSLSDLKGKKIAVQPGSIAQLGLMWKLRELGIQKDVELVFLNNNDMPQPMRTGELDAVHGVEPVPTLIRMNNWAVNVWNPYETPLGKRNVVLIASQKFVKDNPETTRKIVQAHIAATKELQKDNSSAAAAMVKILNIDPKIADEAMKNIFYTYDVGGDFRKSIEAVGDVMQEMGQINAKPDWDKFVNTSFV
ncbi:MAG TPA: ABC transporter substrate-binding protein [Pseudolabrys sp.]|nr:ABC transporter substrate-binding protein [Pseudolabrys sp.]